MVTQQSGQIPEPVQGSPAEPAPDHEARSRANRHLGRDYLGSHIGAPPPPPPGGYRGERRFPSDPAQVAVATAPAQAAAKAPRSRPHALGWVALGAAGLFAIVLLALLVLGGVPWVYGATALLLQLIVVGVIVAALFVPRARLLGALALTFSLVCNVGTAGAMGAVTSEFTGGYGGLMGGPEPSPWADYPGMQGIDPDLVLEERSLEEVQAEADELGAEIRQALTDEFGFTWVKENEGSLRYERNGYGGESLLQNWRSPTWITEQPIRDYTEKLKVMEVIDEILWDTGEYYAMGALNDPSYSSRSDEALTALYGSADPRTQVTWEWATSRTRNVSFNSERPESTLFYALIDDLENDADGTERARAEANAKEGVPIEGLSMIFIQPQVLSEADRAAFEEGTREVPPDE